MTPIPFDLKSHETLPLWAQVLLASRLIRRAVNELPAGTRRTSFVDACGLIDRCAAAGNITASEKQSLQTAADVEPDCDTMAIATAVHYAIDAALGAQSSNDFSAAEEACVRSAGTAIMWACESDGMNPVQAMIYASSDLDLLKFACSEFRVGRYDGLTPHVLSRLTPIGAPE